MKRYLLIEVSYNKHIALPQSCISALDEILLVHEKNERAFEPCTEALTIKLVSESAFTTEAVEASYKEKYEQYEKWWSQSLTENNKLKEEVTKLKSELPQL